MSGQPKSDAASIWCDHCNTAISPSGIRSCLRKTCQSKDKLPGARRNFR